MYPMISQHSHIMFSYVRLGLSPGETLRISPTKSPMEIYPEAPGPHATTRDCQGVAAEAVEVEPAQRGREPM